MSTWSLETEDGIRVGFVDPRRFGCVDLVPTAAEDAPPAAAPAWGRSRWRTAFTPAVLSRRAGGQAHADQGGAARPEAWSPGSATSMSRGAVPRRHLAAAPGARASPGARAARLVPAIKAVLEEAIAAGGSSLRDYVRADGELGRFQDRFAVYDREGQPCPLCPGPPRPARASGASCSPAAATFYCPQDSQR